MDHCTNEVHESIINKAIGFMVKDGISWDLVKDIWGEGATSKLPLGMHTSNPQTHEGEVFHLHSRLSKGFCDPCLGHDTIWRPGQGDEGICRQRKYVDK